MELLNRARQEGSTRRAGTSALLAAASLVVGLAGIDRMMRRHYYQGLAAERPGDGPGPEAPEDSAAVAG